MDHKEMNIDEPSFPEDLLNLYSRTAVSKLIRKPSDVNALSSQATN